MLYNYAATALFIAFAILVPAIFLLVAKLFGKRDAGNPVKNAPYESGEETIGSNRDTDNEYLPYFMVFLPYEIIVGVLVLWSIVAKQTDLSTDMAFVFLGVVATLLSFVGYRLSGN